MYNLQGDCFLMGEKSEHLHYKAEKDGKEYHLQAGCLWYLQVEHGCLPAMWEARSLSSARCGQGPLMGLRGSSEGTASMEKRTIGCLEKHRWMG